MFLNYYIFFSKLFGILLFFERWVLTRREGERERDRGGVGGTTPAFLLNLLGFRHCLQICHFVLII
ncbi:hypothetical protein Hanom_Chr14g01294471 [Helianthus anomalus]